MLKHSIWPNRRPLGYGSLSNLLPALLVLLALLPANAMATDNSDQAQLIQLQADNQRNLRASYQAVDLDQMINNLAASGDKRRIMIEPSSVRFRAFVQQAPKAGTFELVYTALNMWGVEPLPAVNHSAYLRSPDGQVLGVYMEDSAAQRMQALPVDTAAEFYAMHIYNYEHGPRLVVVSFDATAATDSH